jgi:hypothetical protein
MSAGHRIVELRVEEIDRVARLFKQLVGFHREAGAARLYERAGFRPYYRNLMAPLPPGG